MGGPRVIQTTRVRSSGHQTPPLEVVFGKSRRPLHRGTTSFLRFMTVCH
jgi:hypothetical protein